MIFRTFVNVVCEEMKKKKIGIRELARRTGLDPSYISKMLQGKRNPPFNEININKIAEVLDINADVLTIYSGRIPSNLQKLFESREFINKIAAKKISADTMLPLINRSLKTDSPIPNKRSAGQVSQKLRKIEICDELL